MSALQFLLLEANLSDAEEAQTTLTKGGLACELVRVDTRADFIKVLETKTFDLVLSDFALPNFDGMSALQIVLEQHPGVPFIFLSASVGEEQTIEAFTSGATDYVLKHRLERLVPSVQRALRKAQASQKQQERKSAAEIWSEREADFHAMFNTTGVGKAQVDVVTRRFLRVNAAFCTITGYSESELLALTLDDINHPDDREREQDRFLQLLQGKSTSYQSEKRYLRKDGSTIWVLSTANIVHDATGKPLHTAAVIQDITDRKRVELNAEFLANVSQHLIGTTGVDEILQTIGEQLNRYLNISACAFVEINEEADEAIVYNDWHQEDVPSLVGVYSLTKLASEEFQQAVKASQTIVVRDVMADSKITNPQPLTALKIGSFINIPLIKDQQWKFTLNVYHQTPYNWRTDEIELMRELATRIWNRIERLRAEAALRESEAKYRLLFNSMDEGYVLCDVIFDENDRPVDVFYLDVNPAVQRLTGLNLVGKRLREIDSNYESYWWETFGRVAKTGIGERHELYASPLKSWFNFYAFKVGNVNSRRVAAVFQDVTKRKKVEQERERFLAVGSDLLVITNNNGYFQWVSPTFERTLGWTQREMISRPWTDFVHPDDVDASIAETDSLFSGNKTVEFENRYRHKDGSYRWFLWNAQPYPEEQMIYGAAVDITERKQAEEDLRQKNAILNVINESTPTPIFVKDRQGRIIYANPATLNVLGKSAEEVIGYRDCDLYPNLEDAIRVMENDRRIMESGEMEVVEESPDGIRTFLGMKVPYRNEAGDVIGLIGISNDITERVQSEQQREQILQQEQAAREVAEQANRMKDEFLAVLSHELRSPLNPILGWTRLLQGGKLNPAQQAEALGTIERNAKLQTQLIEDLLDISRIMRGKLTLTSTSVSLTFVIAAAAETVQLAAEAKNIEIKLDLDRSIAPVSGDAARLQQVVWNLLSNAVKFTPNGGEVIVELRRLDHQAQIRVIDTGKGINPQFLPYVFEYFRQEDGSTTRRFGGLGLGLAIARQIVELHGGTIEAESLGEDQGATFVVQLPLMQSADPIVPRIAATETESAAAPLNNLRILVVDDDADTREFQAFLLEQSGAEVTAVASGSEALQVLEQSIPDVLVSDVGMANIDGYMLMRQVRSRPVHQGGTIPAIALTAYARDFDQQAALEAGFQAHITKPVEPEILVRTILTLVNRE